MSDYCPRCKKVTESKVVYHSSGTEYLCVICGAQVGFDIDEDYGDDYDDGEPVGSCEQCGTNLYSDDDPDLCDQCLWYAEQFYHESKQDESEWRML